MANLSKSNNNQFISDINKELEKELHFINEQIRDIAFNVVSNAIDSTVVDTTQALSNWILTLESPHSGVEPAKVYGRHGDTTEESKRKTLTESAIKLEEFSLGQTIFIVNDLEDEFHEKNAKTIEAGSIAEDIAFIETQRLESLLGNYNG